MRADRLVALLLLLLLQRRGRLTAASAAQELEVSERTARRDFEALGMAGIPVYALRGRSGGWTLAGGARTDLRGLNAAEVRTLFTLVGPSSEATPELRSALRKLVRALPEPFQPAAEAASKAVVVDRADWHNRPIRRGRPEHLDMMEQAVIEGRQVRLGHRSRDGAATTRIAHPLGLVGKGAAWYLVAGTERGQRTFRLDRVVSLELLDAAAQRPDGFDLASAWQTIAEEVDHRRAPVRARAVVDPGALDIMDWVFGTVLRWARGDLTGWSQLNFAAPATGPSRARSPALGASSRSSSPRACASSWPRSGASSGTSTGSSPVGRAVELKLSVRSSTTSARPGQGTQKAMRQGLTWCRP